METFAAPPPSESKPESPLLPAVLLGPAAFLWLWALPIGVLLLLNFQAWWLVEGNLNATQRSDALFFGAGNVVNLLAGCAIYFVIKWRDNTTATTRRERQPWWGVPALLVQIGYLWWAVAWADRILPPSVTAWIYPTERHLFNQFAFAMLPMFLGILRLAATRAPKKAGRALVLNLAFAIGGPIALYLFMVAVSDFRGSHAITGILFATGMVSFGVVMFVGIVRVLMLGLRSAQRWGSTGERVAIVLFAAILPLGGLLLNRSIPFPVDFQAWEIYALVLANAALLLLASVKHEQWPRLSFYLLSATFPFSLYFFIVFLPYTPLSILAVIVMGAGFLVLSPIFLFVLHLHALHRSRSNPAIRGNELRVTLTGVLCALLLPAFFTARGLADKTALNAALDHVYSPAITGENLTYPASLTNLRRALHSHRSYKNGIYYPLLSDFYSWLVFDNLVLPDDKLDRLEQVFFGSAGTRLNTDPTRSGLKAWGNKRSVRERAHMPRTAATPRTVSVSQLQLKNSPAVGGDVVTTFVLTLQNNGEAPAEFLQKLPLPSGVFVSGFRLHINGQPVPGRLFEKKTALWVYTMIRDSERRDPGLLYYNTRDELELRVFPVNANAYVIVEIDFLHPATARAPDLSPGSNEPAARLAEIGRALRPHVTGDWHELAVAGLNAGEFPPVEREPYLHLIVDRSLDNAYTADLSWVMATLREKFPRARLGRVTLANHDVVDLATQLVPLDDLATKITAESLENLPASGGLALDLCLARAIRQHRDLDLDRFKPGGDLPGTPIFVILSRHALARTLDLGLTENWRDLLPGLDLCEFGADGTFRTHLQATGPCPLIRLGGAMRPLATRLPVRFPSADSNDLPFYWSPKNSAWEPVPDAKRQNGTAWSRAVALQLEEQDHGRNPGDHRLDRKALVTASRENGILLPVTSYIVVENQAQWRMLELSERQKLDQNAALDFRETPAPPAVWLGGGLLLWLGYRRMRRSSRVAPDCPAHAL
ncbi:MAG TPA: MSEP-CTERM sorting domain-containing protein [Opitutaceae bacterium]|nr:MSEP-CTERM sorting domain-containing protein [Opitutaceae bacterium]